MHLFRQCRLVAIYSNFFNDDLALGGVTQRQEQRVYVPRDRDPRNLIPLRQNATASSSLKEFFACCLAAWTSQFLKGSNTAISSSYRAQQHTLLLPTTSVGSVEQFFSRLAYLVASSSFL